MNDQSYRRKEEEKGNERDIEGEREGEEGGERVSTMYAYRSKGCI